MSAAPPEAPPPLGAAGFQALTGVRPEQIADLELYRQMLVDGNAVMNLVGPASLPEAAVTRINADVNDLLKDAAVRDLLAKSGLTAVGGTGFNTPGGPDERLGLITIPAPSAAALLGAGSLVALRRRRK
jgi:uncharacterized protein (TIGR03382 family)